MNNKFLPKDRGKELEPAPDDNLRHSGGTNVLSTREGKLIGRYVCVFPLCSKIFPGTNPVE